MSLTKKIGNIVVGYRPPSPYAPAEDLLWLQWEGQLYEHPEDWEPVAKAACLPGWNEIKAALLEGRAVKVGGSTWPWLA